MELKRNLNFRWISLDERYGKFLSSPLFSSGIEHVLCHTVWTLFSRHVTI